MRFGFILIALGLSFIILGCAAPSTTKNLDKPNVSVRYYRNPDPITSCDTGDFGVCVQSKDFKRVQVRAGEQVPLAVLGTALYKIDEKGVNIQSKGWVKYKLRAAEGEGAWIILGDGATLALTYKGTIFWMINANSSTSIAQN